MISIPEFCWYIVGTLKCSPESSRLIFLQTLLIFIVSPFAIVALISLGAFSQSSSGMTNLLARHKDAPVSTKQCTLNYLYPLKLRNAER